MFVQPTRLAMEVVITKLKNLPFLTVKAIQNYIKKIIVEHEGLLVC